MAKKPGLMNPVKIANLMAGAATAKAQGYKPPKLTEGKLYALHDESDEAQENDREPGDKPNAGHNGAKHPSAPEGKKSVYKGEQFEEMEDGAKSPSSKKPNKSKSQIQKKGY